MGSGSLWISESISDKKIITNIDFGGGEPSQGIFTFSKVDGGTKVSWKFVNHNGWNPLSKLIGRFIIQPMVSNSYKEGLEYLSEVCRAYHTE